MMNHTMFGGHAPSSITHGNINCFKASGVVTGLGFIEGLPILTFRMLDILYHVHFIFINTSSPPKPNQYTHKS